MTVFEQVKDFVVITALLLTATPSLGQRGGQSRRPHIILIVADDLGWSDVGWRDPEMYTPHLDRLARHGVVLNQTYMQPSCSPSRAALMTGYYPFHLGMQHSVINAGRREYLTDEVQIMPQFLKSMGYATHMVGKWHLGFCDWKYTPTYRGFDTFYGFYNSAEGYYNHTAKKNGYDFRDNERVDWSARGTYSTHLFAARAQRIIRDHAPSSPLFLYLPFQAVHGPFEVPQHYIDNHCSHVREHKRRVHCGMVAAMDEAIGNVTDTLESAGLADNAVIVFSTDNGGPTNKGSSNWPLRGSKTTLWEGGTRAVSLVYSASRRLVPGRGRTFNGLMHVVDWLPSLMELAGGTDVLDTAIRGRRLDGVSLWSQVSSGRGRGPRREFVYNIDEVRGSKAIRVGRWKLILGNPKKPNDWAYAPAGADLPHVGRGRNADVHLFDLQADPMETRNLADQQPRRVERLTRRLERHERTLVPSMEEERLRYAHPRFYNNTWSPGACSDESQGHRGRHRQ